MARPTSAVDQLLAWVCDGRPVMSSCSLAKAMQLPLNETHPIDDAEHDLDDLVGRRAAQPGKSGG